MKKVLIIADLFHASPRIPGLAKYLPEFGWEPVLLTTPIDETPNPRFGDPPKDIRDKFRIIQACSPPALGYWRKFLGFDQCDNVGVQIKNQLKIDSDRKLYPQLSRLYKNFEAIVNYPDAEKNWRPFAVEAGSKLLQDEDINAIISSSSPVTSHIIAKELKLKFGTPWIADLRDLWSQNHNYRYGSLRRSFDRRLELKTLKPADSLITVSQIWAEELRKFHRRLEVYAITNGFDPDRINIPDASLTRNFTITYTGQIYTGRQDTSKFCDAVRDLIDDEIIDPNEIEVRFYGPNNGVLGEEIEEFGLQNIIKQYGVIPRDASFKKQHESQILLLLNWELHWNDQREKGWYPLKVFEYLAAQRPILATGGTGNDVVERLLEETGAGTYAVSVKEIKGNLRELYAEYKKKGNIDYKGYPEEVNKYSYRMMAKKFAEILGEIA